jgi:hypothetical protein
MLRRIAGLFRWLHARLTRTRTDAELAEEMAWHRNRLAADLEARGLSPEKGPARRRRPLRQCHQSA